MKDETQRNKLLMQDIFAALAQGNGRPFVDAMADDFVWVMPGGGTWSGAWHGKETVRTQLLRPLFASPLSPPAHPVAASASATRAASPREGTTDGRARALAWDPAFASFTRPRDVR